MRKGITIKTIILLAIFGLTAAIIFSWLIPLLAKSKIEIPLSEGTEIVRFARYIKCAIAACTGGCNSAETYSIVLEYDESGVSILGCNQYLIDNCGCTLYSSDKLCDKGCVLEFEFKEQTKYASDYWVVQRNPDTYKDNPCSSLDIGWQTDFSCIGRPSELYSCPCELCLMYGPHGPNIPYGVLFDSGTSCGTSGKPPFVGSLWLPNSFVTDINPVTGTENCEDGGMMGSLKSCTFPENTKVQIWTDDKKGYGACSFEGTPFQSAACFGNVNDCPRVVVCPIP
jgi:hypothetical protein